MRIFLISEKSFVCAFLEQIYKWELESIEVLLLVELKVQSQRLANGNHKGF